MKIRVSWKVGRASWWHDFTATPEGEQRSLAKVRDLLATGFFTKSKAGVETYYPAHRIGEIKRRQLA